MILFGDAECRSLSSVNMLLLSRYSKYVCIAVGLLFAAIVFFLFTQSAEAATFSISPASGTRTVGSTFDVSVLLDTKGEEINAVQFQLLYPPDKLQLVSPSAGTSIISIYTTPPKYDNNAGRVEIIGGIPNGVNVSAGLVAKLTFRVKGIGQASLRFAGDSQALLNDGRGTNVLDNTSGASYKLELPPQQGPQVLSDTHADQEAWHKSASVSLQWDVGLPKADGYSYTISDNPTDVPDDTIETSDTFVNYARVPDGLNYFHIKAFREGRWGGVSRYSLKIDSTPPAQFMLDIAPNARTFITKPFFQFTTSDTLSGLDRYEVKIVPLKIDGRPKAQIDEQLFVEAQSPYPSPELLYGTYQVVVRAYDKAGNIQEVSRKLEITDSWLWFISQDGLALPFGKQAPWRMIVPIILVVVLGLLGLAYVVRHWYQHYHGHVQTNHLPDTLKSQLQELQQYRSKYGKLAVLFIAALIGWNSVVPARAQELQPPVVGSYSANIKDDELFYVSGRTLDPNTEVVVHLQGLVDGAAFDFVTTSDKRGDWTYRHDSFLAGGQYIVWAHAKAGDQLSAPSPQVTMDVKPVAISWGGSRITYQSLYVTLIVILFVLAVALATYIIVHAVLMHRRRRQFGQQLRQAEDSIKRGFIALRQDIEGELMLIRQAHLNDTLSGEQKVREEQLRKDLKNIEDIVGREIWQVETLEKLPGA